MPFNDKGPWQPVPLPEGLSLDEHIFVIRFTSEMFRCYDDYSERLDGYRKRQWTCEATMATDLTLEEALVSERNCRLLLVMFPRELYGEALSIIQHSTLHLSQLTKKLMDHFRDHPKFMRMKPSLQRDVTKQFIRKHAHKDPYPRAPYKVLPDLVVKYNLATELSNHLAVADIDYQQRLRWRGEETLSPVQPVIHYKVIGSHDPDGQQPLKVCLQKCGSHTPQKWPIDDQLLTEHDRSKEGPCPQLHHHPEPFYSYHGDILMIWHFYSTFKLSHHPLPYSAFHEAIQHEATNGLKPTRLLVEMCIAMVKFIAHQLPCQLDTLGGINRVNWETVCSEILKFKDHSHFESCLEVPEELISNILANQNVLYFGQLSLPHKITLMRYLCDVCVWSGGVRDHMSSDQRVLPLGHDRHGNTHWFFPSIGYFVESHDPSGWGYYSSSHEINQLEEHLNPKGSCELTLLKKLGEHKKAIHLLLDSKSHDLRTNTQGQDT
ncbi:uncharacterized protein [Dysidea avara]|uniref:uncharacterized protein n=1 Tax=Dysidea avara TaxID=196820 RepID=UPI00331FCDB8